MTEVSTIASAQGLKPWVIGRWAFYRVGRPPRAPDLRSIRTHIVSAQERLIDWPDVAACILYEICGIHLEPIIDRRARRG